MRTDTQATLFGEWKGYLDVLMAVGIDGNILCPSSRRTAESVPLVIGRGVITHESIETAKRYVQALLLPRAALGLGPEEGTRSP